VSGEIESAIKRLEERKLASGVVGDKYGELQGEDATRRVFSGLDLDIDEVFEVHRIMARTVLGGLAEGNNAVLVGAGMWFDGLVTGLLIAEARQREEARS
jgi:hypothetical protein